MKIKFCYKEEKINKTAVWTNRKQKKNRFFRHIGKMFGIMV